MKIITLNAWGGIGGKVLFDWLKEQSQSTDIFCFQEIYDSIYNSTNSNIQNKIGKFGENHNLKQDLKDLLPEFTAFY